MFKLVIQENFMEIKDLNTEKNKCIPETVDPEWSISKYISSKIIGR